MDGEIRSKLKSPSILCSLFVLATIRGTFAIIIHYGILAYKGTSLLFLLRTPGTIVLFLLSMIVLSNREEEGKLEILNDLRNTRSYKRAALLGLFQLCGPYVLFMYAMKYLSPSLGAVFMASTPWFTASIEYVLSMTKQTVVGKDWNVPGSVIGLLGMLVVSISDISLVALDTNCHAKYDNVTHNMSHAGHNGTKVYTKNFTLVTIQEDTCKTSIQITTAFLALWGAAILWSLSAVFSRLKRVSLHFLTGGFLNNMFACLYAGIIWLVIEQHFNTQTVVWDSFSGSFSVIMLTFASSWLAVLILCNLYRRIGVEPTNRVMCLVPVITWAEDHIFIKHNQQLWMIILEAIGILLVVIGLYVSSFQRKESTRMTEGLLNEYHSSGDEDDAQRRLDQLTDSGQSEDALLQDSGSSTMLDSVDPPMIHYVDDAVDEE